MRCTGPSGPRAASLRVFDPVDDSLQQRDFFLPQVLGPMLGNPGDARGEAGDAQHVGRAAFEQVGELSGLSRAGGVAAGAPLAPGPDPAVGSGADVKSTGAGRAVERLVARERQHVDRRGAKVDRHHARRLGRVDQEESALPRGRSRRWPRSAGRSPARWRRESSRRAWSRRRALS